MARLFVRAERAGMPHGYNLALHTQTPSSICWCTMLVRVAGPLSRNCMQAPDLFPPSQAPSLLTALQPDCNLHLTFGNRYGGCHQMLMQLRCKLHHAF